MLYISLLNSASVFDPPSFIFVLFFGNVVKGYDFMLIIWGMVVYYFTGCYLFHDFIHSLLFFLCQVYFLALHFDVFFFSCSWFDLFYFWWAGSDFVRIRQ